MIGKTISRYRIIEKLGEGGMGVVYKAEDLKLKRTVALKFLSPSALTNEEDKVRFLHEAQAAAALRHPGICAVYEIDEEADKTFIVMEYIEGQSLKHKIAVEPPTMREALDIVFQIAEALDEAHEKHIVHRDVKPANIIMTAKGQAVVTDFGLAKSSRSAHLTRTGTTIGTAAYMSPEQARGEEVDRRTDVWSVGVLLYQMVTGRLPFEGEFEHAVIYSILNSEPVAPSKIKPDIPIGLERAMSRALAKDVSRRFQSIRELLDAIAPFGADSVSESPRDGSPGSLLRGLKRPALAIPAVILVSSICVLSILYARHANKIRWARKEALPEILRLVDRDEYVKAFGLAREAKKIIPSDPVLLRLWPEMSTTVSIHTSPPDAGAYTKNYGEPEDQWTYLGQTPIDSLDVPRGFFRWKVQKEGYETVETAGSAEGQTLRLALDKAGTIPDGMVKIPSGEERAWIGAMGRFGTIIVEDFFIDRYEVTNGQYKNFVDAGGYERPELWKHDFVKDGQRISWDQAMKLFRDATGRPGPGAWELGTFPEGRENYPVTGVSWYEAAAYAEFVGKDLPTLYHWIYAASIRASAHIIPLSNIGGQKLAPVESHQGVSCYGTYDMAGNAREWCFNSNGVNRFVLGGSWSDPSYMFHFYDARSAFDRSPGNGVRCARYSGDDSTVASARQNISTEPTRNYDEEKPVPDEILGAYLNMYSYDKTPLNARVEFVDEEPEHWKMEKVSFDAAYGNERLFAYLFLPRGFSPPYQTIVFFPGAYAMELRSSNNGRRLNSWDAVDFVVKSGRAVMYPVYKSTYERRDGYNVYDPNTTMTAHMEHIVMWWKDLSRSVDYLETRADIDNGKLCYYGSSQGAWTAPIFLGQDERYKAAVLRLGGFPTIEANPAIDPINFTPRVRIPVLMVNGRYDYIFPYETSQLPMFRAFGTPPEHKRHVVFETAHSVYGHRNEMIREVLDWLDRYLGPAK